MSELPAARIAAPFGVIDIRSDGGHVVGIDYLPPGTPLIVPPDALSREAARQVTAYLRDPRFRFHLPLAPGGTAFQRRVWQAIAAIPVGGTRSYADIAAELASSPRAVGQACGANPLPILIPCHRVVAKSGGMGGFMHSRGDFPLSVKYWLLDHERH